MRRRPKRSLTIFFCLTLVQQDISELIHLFQKDLQDVEILIDDLPVLERTQLEQFDTTYQATSLLARGYDGSIGDESGGPGERSFLELKMARAGATLLMCRWSETSKVVPGVNEQVKRVLSRCQNQVYQVLYIAIVGMFVGLPLSLFTVFQQHHVAYLLQILLVVLSGFLLMPSTYFLFLFIARHLHIGTHIFLFPGAISLTRMYGWREAVSRFIIALLVLALFDFCLLGAFHILWR